MQVRVFFFFSDFRQEINSQAFFQFSIACQLENKARHDASEECLDLLEDSANAVHVSGTQLGLIICGIEILNK